MILAIIAQIGAAGGTGHVIEYAGQAIRDMSVEGRLTVCNMSIEAGARAGMVAPDDTTFAYLKGRRFAPQGARWDQALAFWRTLPSDPGAAFDAEVTLDGSAIAPMATWGTSPEDAAGVSAAIPDPAARAHRGTPGGGGPRAELHGPDPRHADAGHSDQSRVHRLLHQRPASRICAPPPRWCRAAKCACRPGRFPVRAWSSGRRSRRGWIACSATPGSNGGSPAARCALGMNGDLVEPGEHCASTSNRNFVGRQGQGARTHLMSPAMAAAAAVTGHVTDLRRLTTGAA